LFLQLKQLVGSGVIVCAGESLAIRLRLSVERVAWVLADNYELDLGPSRLSTKHATRDPAVLGIEPKIARAAFCRTLVKGSKN